MMENASKPRTMKHKCDYSFTCPYRCEDQFVHVITRLVHSSCNISPYEDQKGERRRQGKSEWRKGIIDYLMTECAREIVMQNLSRKHR